MHVGYAPEPEDWVVNGNPNDLFIDDGQDDDGDIFIDDGIPDVDEVGPNALTANLEPPPPPPGTTTLTAELGKSLHTHHEFSENEFYFYTKWYSKLF